MSNIYKLHGLPSAIIFDRDMVFISHCCQEFLKFVDTHMRIAYHPQSDGQTEWVTVSQTMVSAFWYNTSRYSAHGLSPFEVLYGHPSKHFGANFFER